ncbi:uncharacterized protein LOC103516588 [Diaphorina citri]|uniref:Uncharacterized protein LOC103516588 n=1 Tax=Diaphorina citri TaxID=121845 RepID=A0A1S3DDW5_DIACI|nr:uncharacterized protein LOC103516588 [Diaphorina citri]
MHCTTRESRRLVHKPPPVPRSRSTSRSRATESFSVLPPLSPQIPAPPRTPEPYRLTPTQVKRDTRNAFVILPEVSPPVRSRSPSPGGRASPFKIRTFRESTLPSRHASREPSPEKRKSILKRKSSLSSSPTRFPAKLPPTDYRRRQSLSPGRAILIENRFKGPQPRSKPDNHIAVETDNTTDDEPDSVTPRSCCCFNLFSRCKCCNTCLHKCKQSKMYDRIGNAAQCCQSKCCGGLTSRLGTLCGKLKCKGLSKLACCSKLSCCGKLKGASSCCKRTPREVDVEGQGSEPKVTCAKRLKNLWRFLCCLNTGCCRRIQDKCGCCKRLACCKMGGCCGPLTPEEEVERQKRNRMKKSKKNSRQTSMNKVRNASLVSLEGKAPFSEMVDDLGEGQWSMGSMVTVEPTQPDNHIAVETDNTTDDEPDSVTPRSCCCFNLFSRCKCCNTCLHKCKQSKMYDRIGNAAQCCQSKCCGGLTSRLGTLCGKLKSERCEQLQSKCCGGLTSRLGTLCGKLKCKGLSKLACCSKLSCCGKLKGASSCCKRTPREVDVEGQGSEPKVTCAKRLKNMWRFLCCLNTGCCRRIQDKCGCCKRLACCKMGGCCGPLTPEEEVERQKRNRMKKSKKNITQSIFFPPFQEQSKIDPSMVEHQSIMRAGIPILPVGLAWICMILNVLIPGSGTFMSGLFCLCVGKPRFQVNDTPFGRLGAFIVQCLVALAQVFTILFCLVGWGWSIWWGTIMLKLAKKHQRMKQAERNETEAPVTNQNHVVDNI